MALALPAAAPTGPELVFIRDRFESVDKNLADRLLACAACFPDFDFKVESAVVASMLYADIDPDPEFGAKLLELEGSEIDDDARYDTLESQLSVL